MANRGFYGPNEGNRKAKIISGGNVIRGNFRPSRESTMRGTPKIMAKTLFFIIIVGLLAFLFFAYFFPPEPVIEGISLIPIDDTTKIEVNGTTVVLTHSTSMDYVYAQVGRQAFPLTTKRIKLDSFHLSLAEKGTAPPGFVAVQIYQ
jgi:hypothetical protein